MIKMTKLVVMDKIMNIKIFEFKRFNIVILTKNKTPISEASNKGIICRIGNFKRQTYKERYHMQSAEIETCSFLLYNKGMVVLMVFIEY